MRAKKDTSHKEITQALEALGCTVSDTSRLGDGFPDMVVIMPDGECALVIEAKTEGQIDFKPKEIKFMISLVKPAFRVLLDAQGAARMFESLIIG